MQIHNIFLHCKNKNDIFYITTMRICKEKMFSGEKKCHKTKNVFLFCTLFKLKIFKYIS